MELFTRLIEEGIFIFWSDEENHDSYRLSFSINNMDKMINILTADVENTQHYYSLKNVGAGDYEISLSGIKNGGKATTLTRKVKLSSSSQRNYETMERLDAIKGKLEELISDTYNGVLEIQNILKKPNDYKDVDSYVDFERALRHEREMRGW